MRLALRLGVWSPLLWVTLLRGGLLLGLFFFARPEIVKVGEPIVRFLGGEEAAHYPAHLYLLLRLYQPIEARDLAGRDRFTTTGL